MISGMNTETEYQGKRYHIQTEDGGRSNPVIITQVFVKGAILLTRKTNYADIIKAEYLESIVKDLMKQQHTLMIKGLLSGTLFDKPPTQGQASQSAGASNPAPVKDGGTSGKQSSGKKSLDDMILDYLVGKKEKEGS
jgi:hypothetical protein